MISFIRGARQPKGHRETEIWAVEDSNAFGVICECGWSGKLTVAEIMNASQSEVIQHISVWWNSHIPGPPIPDYYWSPYAAPEFPEWAT